jgi:hypothetical protein
MILNRVLVSRLFSLKDNVQTSFQGVISRDITSYGPLFLSCPSQFLLPSRFTTFQSYHFPSIKHRYLTSKHHVHCILYTLRRPQTSYAVPLPKMPGSRLWWTYAQIPGQGWSASTERWPEAFLSPSYTPPPFGKLINRQLARTSDHTTSMSRQTSNRLLKKLLRNVEWDMNERDRLPLRTKQ